ncbi:MAG: methionine biosynthesis protein MetW [Candidatus Omnitrophota bacterium]
MSAQDKSNRLDYRVITDLIEPDSKVLDLGCGNGDLLSLLIQEKNARATGIEINESAIYQCVEKGLTVSQGDIDSGLADYSDKRFDYVILNESLQEVLHPEKVILESLRVGKKAIVGIPNFCHIIGRFQIFFQGRVPVTKELPYQWYDTPNLRFLSIKDFRLFCKAKGIIVEQERTITAKSEITSFRNLLGRIGIFLLSKG